MIFAVLLICNVLLIQLINASEPLHLNCISSSYLKSLHLYFVAYSSIYSTEPISLGRTICLSSMRKMLTLEALIISSICCRSDLLSLLVYMLLLVTLRRWDSSQIKTSISLG